eukprot:TRINITY_DN225_c0_g1_i1.p1 TRINITY_DN225_c0_g1~~TRINITY_DN225_c0_g1_i1.p1  ORF type:complete len:738 (+),score=194.46 TRINITY_DN225_c0_g1_i1:843-3056(+)
MLHQVVKSRKAPLLTDPPSEPAVAKLVKTLRPLVLHQQWTARQVKFVLMAMIAERYDEYAEHVIQRVAQEWTDRIMTERAELEAVEQRHSQVKFVLMAMIAERYDEYAEHVIQRVAQEWTDRIMTERAELEAVEQRHSQAEFAWAASVPALHNPAFLCPITTQLMDDPVICCDGHTYERSAIQNWFMTSSRSPMTNWQLENKSLVTNTVLRQLIEQARQQARTAPTQQQQPPQPAPAQPAAKSFWVYDNYSSHEFVANSAQEAIQMYTARPGWGGASNHFYDQHGKPVQAHTRVIFRLDAAAESKLVKVTANGRQGWISVCSSGTIIHWLVAAAEYAGMYDELCCMCYDVHQTDGQSYIRNYHLSQDAGCIPSRNLERLWEGIDIRVNKLEGKSYNDGLDRSGLARLMFESFVSRVVGYDLAQAWGLVRFGDSAKILSPIQSSLEIFRESLSALHPSGETALYDAIHVATGMLTSYNGKVRADCLKRIVVLTDGVDHGSTKTSSAAFGACRENNIHLDMVYMDTTPPFRFPGDGFVIRDPTHAIKLCESETFLSLAIRPRTGEGRVFRDGASAAEVAPALMLTQRSPPPAMLSRILSEYSEIAQAGHRYYQATLVQDSLSHWLVTFGGFEDGPYAGGRFSMHLFIEGDYPNTPPRVRMQQPVVPHCNMSAHGRVCHSIVGRNWTADTHMKTLLDCIYGLFLTPEQDDPLDTELAMLMRSDPQVYEQRVRQWIQRNCR